MRLVRGPGAGACALRKSLELGVVPGARAERPEEEGPELVHVVLRADPSDGTLTALGPWLGSGGDP